MTVIRQRMIDDMQVRNLSPHTQASYLQQVSLFARYFRTSPDALNPEHIRTYQIYLTNEKKLAPASIDTYGRCRTSFSLSDYAQERMDVRRRYPVSQEATKAACHLER